MNKTSLISKQKNDEKMIKIIEKEVMEIYAKFPKLSEALANGK